MKIVTFHNDEPRAGTLLIALGFEREHEFVRKLIHKHRERFESFGPLVERQVSQKEAKGYRILNPVASKYAGTRFKEYLLNEDQAMFLGTLLRNTEIVLDFKQRLIHEFSKARKALAGLRDEKQFPEWQLARAKGKLVRNEATATMKRFIKYAEAQGSAHANNYYMAITTMLNAALFSKNGKFKNLRACLTTRQLMTVATVEQIIDRALNEGMESGLHYKDIFQLAKSRVIQFVSLYGKTEVIEQSLSQLQLEQEAA